ncbi:enoyl-CoA hydratase/isomerase family protein [Rhodococcus aetherivorans]
MSELNVSSDGAVRVLEINRPEAMNALNGRLIRDVRDEVVRAAADPSVRVAVLTGTGTRAFSAGADLEELDGLDVASAQRIMHEGQQAFCDIASADVPVIAAVNGLALGGGFELVLASTFALTSESASFGLPESRLGLIPGYGGTQRLAPLVGQAAAAQLMLTGERLTAQRAYELGLTVLPPVAPELLMTETMKVAHVVAGNGPAAIRSILHLVRQAHGSSSQAERLAAETDAAVEAIVGAESTEGIQAFRERRTAGFPDLVAAGNEEMR